MNGKTGWVGIGAALAVIGGCGLGVEPAAGDCDSASILSAEAIIACLEADRVLSRTSAQMAREAIADARRVADSLDATGSYEDLLRSKFVIRALQHLADIYDQGGVRDSARLNRLVDHVAVSADFVRGRLEQDDLGLYSAARTPGIRWTYLPNIGIYAEPTATVIGVLGYAPGNIEAPLEPLIQTGEALWAYAVALPGGGGHPVWELQYPASVCTIYVPPPRRSAAAQGAAIRLFAELARRTSDARWVARGEAALEALRRSWDEGGVRVDVNGHAWWEEADPRVRMWRTAAATAVAVWDLADAGAGEPARELAEDGIAAVRAEVDRFDDGVWTRYCLSGGYQDRDNHRLFIALADALLQRTGDAYWGTVADRWRSYVPPAGFLQGDVPP